MDRKKSEPHGNTLFSDHNDQPLSTKKGMDTMEAQVDLGLHACIMDNHMRHLRFLMNLGGFPIKISVNLDIIELI